MNPTKVPDSTEIAIVGAGPTGLALAVTLASAGIESVIVDRLSEGQNTRVPPSSTPARWRCWTSWTPPRS